MTSEAILVDIADNVGKNVKRGRNSFYSLPKTLSEDDDPFGLFQNPRPDRQQSVGEGGIMMGSVTEKEEPNTGLLVQIETESPRISISESFNSVSSRFANIIVIAIFDTFYQELYLWHGCGYAGSVWALRDGGLLCLRNVSKRSWGLIREHIKGQLQCHRQQCGAV